ncbi:MAG: hypothetical protein Q7S65_05300 [Nanoarchaeota archaeon]|nr:hypothetical protein [Nanoarchaeota archaeon]
MKTAIVLMGALLLLVACAQKLPETTDNRSFVSTDLDECSRLKFMCIQGMEPFSDETGCGCKPVQEEGKLQAVDCLPEQRNAEICTLEYRPVCGWNDPAKIQCIRYPCAQTYSNPCSACQNENVISYTEGECPKE